MFGPTVPSRKPHSIRVHNWPMPGIRLHPPAGLVAVVPALDEHRQVRPGQDQFRQADEGIMGNDAKAAHMIHAHVHAGVHHHVDVVRHAEDMAELPPQTAMDHHHRQEIEPQVQTPDAAVKAEQKLDQRHGKPSLHGVDYIRLQAS